jgi:hypothetical protein
VQQIQNLNKDLSREAKTMQKRIKNIRGNLSHEFGFPWHCPTILFDHHDIIQLVTT